MSTPDENPYSTYFARFAAKLEDHLRRNGVSCDDADMIIEESSAIYFRRLGTLSKSFNLLKKNEPSKVFVESACSVIAIRIPEAAKTFGSPIEIEKMLR